MNKQDRTLISELVGNLDGIQASVQELMDAEQEKLDNIPEQLQDGEPAEKLKENLQVLEDVLFYLDNASLELQNL